MSKVIVDIEDAVLDCVKDRYSDGEMPDDKSVTDLALYAIASGTEVKHGRWIEHHNDALGMCLRDQLGCSICGKWQCGRHQPYRSFCPNCGADMRGDTDGKS